MLERGLVIEDRLLTLADLGLPILSVVGTVDEIAAMICWLCSEEASFSTGAVFDCSGGRATY